MLEYTCSGCSKSQQAKRLPRGWHHDAADNAYCPTCWQDRYIIRAVTIPVAGPVDGSWPELRESLKTVWRASTRLSNWAWRELAKADITRIPEMKKLPKLAPVYLYPGAREIAPEIDTGSTVAILHAVEGSYRQSRYEAVWLGQRGGTNYRYPSPYRVRAQDWRALRGDDGEALVSVRLAGRRWTLRLRGGNDFRRQLRAHAKLVDGLAVSSELVLYEQRVNGNDHRPGMTTHDSGGQRAHSRVMCKLVGWLPRQAKQSLSGVLFVRTDKDSLLFALDVKGERVWIEHCDQVRRWTAEHYRRLNRWSDDQKAEQRPTATYQSRRQAAVIKYRRRLDSLCQEVASHLANFASRRRYAVVRYADSEHGFCDRFPWHRLKLLMEQKLDERGIQLESESSGDAENPGTSRNDTKEE